MSSSSSSYPSSNASSSYEEESPNKINSECLTGLISTFFGGITALWKSATLGLIIQKSIFSLLILLAKNHEDRNLESAQNNLYLGASIAIPSALLLFYAKKSQTQSRPSTSSLPINNEEEPLLATNKKNHKNCSNGFKFISLAFFALADAILNDEFVFDFSSKSESGMWTKYAIASLFFILYVLQNIRYSMEISTGNQNGFFNNPVAKVADYTAVLGRFSAAKYSLFALIWQSDLNILLKLLLSIPLVEPTLYLSKWSNYQNIDKNFSDEFSFKRFFQAIYLAFAYALQDAALYTKSVIENPLLTTLFVEYPVATLIVYGVFASTELIAYLPKFYELLHSDQIDEAKAFCGKISNDFNNCFCRPG